MGEPPFDQAFYLDTRHEDFAIQVAFLGERQGLDKRQGPDQQQGKPDCWSWVNGALADVLIASSVGRQP